MSRTVWLSDGWATKAHSIDGKANSDMWATPCGQKIQVRKGNTVDERGIIISWDLLNPERMELCKKCFPGSPANE
jgi:hypothetical protein